MAVGSLQLAIGSWQLAVGSWQLAVENKTVVTRPRHGEKLNKYDVVYERYNIPVKFNFETADMKWVRYEPKAELTVLPRIYKKGIYLPVFFFGKNIIHLPTAKCHIYTTTTGAMKNTYLIDTNLLIYANNRDSELHEHAINILQDALNGDTKAYIADKALFVNRKKHPPDPLVRGNLLRKVARPDESGFRFAQKIARRSAEERDN